MKVPRHERRLVGAQVPVFSNDPTSVTFVIYARDRDTAQIAIRMLEKSIEDDYIERTFSARIIMEFKDDQVFCLDNSDRGCCSHDCMVVGFTTTYAISAYHH